MDKKLSLDYLKSYKIVLEEYIEEITTDIEKEEKLLEDFLKKVDRDKLGEIKLLRFDREKDKISKAIEEMNIIKKTIQANIEQLDKIIKRIEFNGYDHELARKRVSNLHDYILDKMDYLIEEFIED